MSQSTYDLIHHEIQPSGHHPGTSWWVPLLLLWVLDPSYPHALPSIDPPIESVAPQSAHPIVGPPLPPASPPPNHDTPSATQWANIPETTSPPTQHPAPVSSITPDPIPKPAGQVSPQPTHGLAPSPMPPAVASPVVAPWIADFGTGGAVIAMNGVLEAQQPVRAGTMGAYSLDLEWHRPITDGLSWHSMLGLYPQGTGMTTEWRWLHLLHQMPQYGMTTHIGRHFIPFGWLSQQFNETSPFAVAPLLSQYTWGGNIVGDGIMGQWQVAGPVQLQIGGWVHEPKPGATGFGPAHQIGLIRTVWQHHPKDGLGLSASFHHMKGSGPLHQSQRDHVDWIGTDVKLDIPLGHHHTATVIAEWMGIERQLGTHRMQRSGGYASGWISNEWIDWGARIDWIEQPDLVLSSNHRIGLLFNVRHAPGAALQLFYSHDPGPLAAHQLGACYLLVLGTHHHPIR